MIGKKSSPNSSIMQSLQSVVANLKGPFDYKETAKRLDEVSNYTMNQLAQQKLDLLQSPEKTA